MEQQVPKIVKYKWSYEYRATMSTCKWIVIGVTVLLVAPACCGSAVAVSTDASTVASISFDRVAVSAESFNGTDAYFQRSSENTPLDVEITSGDPIREEGTTTNYSVFGELGGYSSTANELVLYVDGVKKSVDFEVTDLSETSAISNKTVFASNTFSLSDGKKRVEVRVTDPSGQLAEKDTVRLDGDGLRPSVEEDITETDPFDPDSDSDVTSTDESDDGTVDGLEDFDGDGLMTREEILFKTDPFKEDSDSDQLQDGFELRYGLDPLSEDTNNDSTLDADWDFDSDGLDNLREQTLNTNPRLSDTDADNLNDSEEVNVHNTEPNDEDTDNDTILDGSELRIGTDPLSDDSDDDGTLDGNELYTSTKENERYGVGMDITGRGYLAKNVWISRVGSVDFPSSKKTEGAVSQAVDIELPDSFESAKVTFDYEGSGFENESTITIARYNETTGYQPVETKINEQADTAEATISRSSIYAILDLGFLADRIREGGIEGQTDDGGTTNRDGSDSSDNGEKSRDPDSRSSSDDKSNSGNESNERGSRSAVSSGSNDRIDETPTGDGTENGDERLPGFTVMTALLALLTVVAAVVRQREG